MGCITDGTGERWMSVSQGGTLENALLEYVVQDDFLEYYPNPRGGLH